MGVGPKIGRIALPYLVITIVLTVLYPQVFAICNDIRQSLLIAGIILMAVALIIYAMTIRVMVPGIRENRLVTNGPYRFSRNPLYVTLIFLLIPGLALALNSWLVVTASIIACILFRIYIHEEEELLERIFGEEFSSYKSRTGRYCRLF